MEPIKVNIEVSLSDKTLEVLQNIATAICSSLITNNIDKAITKFDPTPDQRAQVEDAVVDTIKGAAAVVRGKTEPTPAPTVEAAPEAPQEAEPGDDMPDFSKEKTDYTDDDLVAVMDETKKRLIAANRPISVIKQQVFAKYGITCSVKCPKEQRAAMVKDLRSL